MRAISGSATRGPGPRPGARGLGPGARDPDPGPRGPGPGRVAWGPWPALGAAAFWSPARADRRIPLDSCLAGALVEFLVYTNFLWFFLYTPTVGFLVYIKFLVVFCIHRSFVFSGVHKKMFLWGNKVVIARPCKPFGRKTRKGIILPSVFQRLRPRPEARAEPAAPASRQAWPAELGVELAKRPASLPTPRAGEVTAGGSAARRPVGRRLADGPPNGLIRGPTGQPVAPAGRPT